MTIDLDRLAWDKMDGLLPAVVQDADTAEVLMVGYMDRAAVEQTLDIGQVTFFSRSKQRLWTKGETSGHTLALVELRADCDQDALLVTARPRGPVCHLKTQTCFGDETRVALSFLGRLQRLVEQRRVERPEGSYTTALFDMGARRIAQKVGEEGLEAALAGATGDIDNLIDESADVLFHLLVLLSNADLSVHDALERLRDRHRA